MSKLSFNQQIILCLLIQFLGFALSILTDIGWFDNAALMLNGIIFILHPVAPYLRELQPNAKMEVRVGGILLILVAVLFRFNT